MPSKLTGKCSTIPDLQVSHPSGGNESAKPCHRSTTHTTLAQTFRRTYALGLSNAYYRLLDKLGAVRGVPTPASVWIVLNGPALIEPKLQGGAAKQVAIRD
ncbi:hypothetical protein [Paraburkholderia sp. BR13444]|uniref:hypothetical protein n=1 Tax=Paraburkholderia sp. BR13444 TaxID=3236997 RepID=UPI0034CDF9D0